jgi:hypothetical protein
MACRFIQVVALHQATASLVMGGSNDACSFSWNGLAQQVEVAGTFNDWRTPGVPLQKYQDEFHMVELMLPPGIHQYKYIVDGRWSHSECAPVVKIGMHNVNNVVLVKGDLGGGARLPPPPAAPVVQTSSSVADDAVHTGT